MIELLKPETEIWRVSVEAPLREALTYQASPDLFLQRGQSVVVPLGKRQVRGLLLEKITPNADESSRKFVLKNVIGKSEDLFPIPENYLQWLEWLSKYYMHPVGQVSTLFFPPLKKKGRKTNSFILQSHDEPQKKSLNEEQDQIVADISKSLECFSTHLIFGVTGSGKTEVYLELFEKILQQKKQGLFIVPEISLTPQLVDRFNLRFPNQIAVIHSQLTDRERTIHWWEMTEKKKQILIGARSALFCPLPDLGLIVIDEEHELNFKQDEKLKYQARDSAVMLARLSGCPIILGSATPSLESWKNAQEGRYHLHRLKNRFGNSPLPTIEIIDMKEDVSKISEGKLKTPNLQKNRPLWLSEKLFEALQVTLGKGQQSALFLNRRGYSPLVLCPACGYTYDCPNCDIKLTLHGKNHLVCHYCEYTHTKDEVCPDCHEGEIKSVGFGTEQIESDLRKYFPQARVARADRDEVQNRHELEDLIQKMENHEIDILVGTQMIAKGLDFKKLNLVGLVLADLSFQIPDFRSTERSFQLFTQMAGRSGRHVGLDQDPGRVFLQTYNVDHPSLLYLVKNDIEGFINSELENRKELYYPPFGRLLSVRFQSLKKDSVENTAEAFATRAKALLANPQYQSQYAGIEILGPSEAPISKIRNQFRFQILLKSTMPHRLQKFYLHLMGDQNWIPASVRVSPDVDPAHLL